MCDAFYERLGEKIDRFIHPYTKIMLVNNPSEFLIELARNEPTSLLIEKIQYEKIQDKQPYFQYRVHFGDGWFAGVWFARCNEDIVYNDKSKTFYKLVNVYQVQIPEEMENLLSDILQRSKTWNFFILENSILPDTLKECKRREIITYEGSVPTTWLSKIAN